MFSLLNPDQEPTTNWTRTELIEHVHVLFGHGLINLCIESQEERRSDFTELHSGNAAEVLPLSAPIKQPRDSGTYLIPMHERWPMENALKATFRKSSPSSVSHLSGRKAFGSGNAASSRCIV